MPNDHKRFLSPTRINHTLIISMVLLSLWFVFTLLYRCNFGIDLTDEGIYLNLISNPWIYKESFTQFGFVYQPLYQMVGESIVRLRQADMLIMLGLAWILCAKLLSFVLIEPGEIKTYPSHYIHGLSFTLATCVFTFFGSNWWIPTPSYNSLALEGLLIIVIALLNIPLNKNHYISSCILGFGGWLTFMAKPTSALLVGLLTIIYIAVLKSKTLKKIRFLFLSLLAFFGFFAISAWFIDGSIHDFILRLSHGLEHTMLLYQGNTFELRPSSGFLPDKLTGLIFIILLTPFFLALNLSLLRKSTAQISFIYTLLILGGFICTNQYMPPLMTTPLIGILILVIPFGMGAALLTIPHKAIFKASHRNYSMMAVFFILLPYIFVFGHCWDVWSFSFRMGLFWVIAAIPLIGLVNCPPFVRWRIMITLIVSSQILTITLVQANMEHPYRQLQSLRSQTKTIDIINTKGRLTSQLIIGDDDARYISELKKVALNHGFQYGDAIIDLTGAHPTALYLLGAKAIGSPWYLLDYGMASSDTVAYDLSQIPCHDIVRSWVLTSLNGIERHDPKMLEPYGMNSTSLQTIHPTIHARDNQIHQLLKPIQPYNKAIEICKKTHDRQLRARNGLQKIMKKNKPYAREIIALSSTYFAENKFPQSTLLLSHATQIYPHNPTIYNNLCFAYTLQKEYDPAIKACSQAIQLDPNFQLAKNNLAWATQEKNQILNK